jgi:anti-sigma regulatory factor (Ser/Thr protein kinase)
MDRPIRISVPAGSMMIGVVRNCATAIAAGMNFSKGAQENIKLSLNEALANVIEHVYGGESAQRIDINFLVNNRDLEIRVRDYGPKVDPSRIKSRRLDQVEPRGLGVFIMKKMMDRVEYDTSPEVGTELLLVKKLGTGKRKAK